jgi:hypothetical protein
LEHISSRSANLALVAIAWRPRLSVEKPRFSTWLQRLDRFARVVQPTKGDREEGRMSPTTTNAEKGLAQRAGDGIDVALCCIRAHVRS